MKKYKVAFWITTIFLFLMEGVLPILTVNSPLSIQGITSLGYPVYFITMLAVFKALGGLALILPMVPNRIKEWAYAGFAIDFLSAFISISVVMGFSGENFLPIIALVILVISYTSREKINTKIK